MQCIRTVGWSLLRDVLIYLWLATCSELNEFSGTDITACSNSFVCTPVILMGREKREKGVMPPLAMPLMRDPGASVSYLGI